MKRRAVFIDRDGVLNRAVVRDGRPYPPASDGDVEILSGVPESLRALKAAGFVLVVVSNQPDVARGTTARATVEAINARLAGRLPLDRFIMCYHDAADGCECRKPKPGMLLEMAREFDIELNASFMVGDRWRDMEAGAAAGCKTVFIDYGYDEQRPQVFDYRVFSAGEAFSTILEDVRMKRVEDLKVKIFADGADKAGMLQMAGKPYIKGLTTNPTLMRKAGVTDYRAFAVEILAGIREKPISFEVFSDEFNEMERQALEIAGWADNVYVKVPVTNNYKSLPMH